MPFHTPDNTLLMESGVWPLSVQQIRVRLGEQRNNTHIFGSSEYGEQLSSAVLWLHKLTTSEVAISLFR